MGQRTAESESECGWLYRNCGGGVSPEGVLQGYRYWAGIGVLQSCESALTHYRLVANHGTCFIFLFHPGGENNAINFKCICFGCSSLNTENDSFKWAFNCLSRNTFLLHFILKCFVVGI